MAERKTAKNLKEEAAAPGESQAVLEATFDDLDAEQLNEYLQQLAANADERAALPDIYERTAALGLVKQLGGVWRPTIAALLLFGRKPQQFIPHSSIKLARFKGDNVTGLIIDRAELFGTLDKLVEDTARFVGRNMRIEGRIEGMRREDIPEYPITAVREAIVNAVAHRDYSINGQKVTLRMFDDRLEIESPGGLVAPVTLETLGQKRYSRNPLLTRLMYELRLVEEMGTGIKKIRRSLAEIGSAPPVFSTDEDSFMATLPARPSLEQPATAPQASQAPAEEPLFQLTAENRAEYFGLLREGLNERQARGLLYAREKGRLTNKDYRAVNPDITDETARLDLVALVDKGYLMRFGDRKGAAYLPR